MASGFAEDAEALPIRTDARVLAATLEAGETATYDIGAGRSVYLVPATGKLDVNGVTIGARDGAAIRDVATLSITALEAAEIVMVDTV